MSGKYLQCGMRLVLSAVLIVTTSMPPGLGHSHAQGDEPHRHDQVSAGHRHGHGHHHRHGASATVHHQHNASDRGAQSSAAGAFDLDRHAKNAAPSRAHVHMCWLGFELTLPSSSIPNDSHPAEDPSAPCFVRLIDSVATEERPQSESSPIAPNNQVDSLAMAEAVCLVAPHASKPACGPSLCDTARHERSGVQLS
jgi:hypothetical protein